MIQSDCNNNQQLYSKNNQLIGVEDYGSAILAISRRRDNGQDKSAVKVQLELSQSGAFAQEHQKAFESARAHLFLHFKRWRRRHVGPARLRERQTLS